MNIEAIRLSAAQSLGVAGGSGAGAPTTAASLQQSVATDLNTRRNALNIDINTLNFKRDTSRQVTQADAVDKRDRDLVKVQCLFVPEGFHQGDLTEVSIDVETQQRNYLLM